MTKKFYSNGKLLLTGEYVVLDGATSLAVPTIYGQNLTVTKTSNATITWKSIDVNNNTWFSTNFRCSDLHILNTEEKDKTWIDTAKTLQSILKEAQLLNSGFLKNTKGLAVETKLDFPRDWGLGSSSTLINNIATWAKVDAFKLLENTMEGSGYDIACAQNNTPIFYQKINSIPTVKIIEFNPLFIDHLYFIHLNKKQNSRDAIAAYKECTFNKEELIKDITEITKKIASATLLSTFEALINKHEELLSNALKTTTAKELLFADYNGAIKSLGAWGGDFILATGNKETPSYFKQKGYNTIFKYTDFIK
ncbi:MULTISPECIES: GYDIA family GHMP kinase [unclassified Cellulophaga]|uniref:GYDIA family GHMP kinase n=1 Tax=unclassified Cellulophaga TaxID=2634405 RepID=UPI0026E4587A|nr:MULTISPECIES: GYDIA family GHMP kinase [unclassified Cellulophaga]MDO6491842.1 GYDIA family GHMP kinase [Cellulophaga sp. 2_MG-2023]MDO6495503.1 GYDIA family GHMP kinase [Cellulophaga sp. 3_MG-2023]